MNKRENLPSTFQIVTALLALYIVWGSTYWAIRVAVQTLPPFLMAATRFLVSGVVLYAWLRFRGQAAPIKAHWCSAFVIGALLLAGGNGAVVWAEQTVPSGVAALLVSVVPLWMALFGWLRPGGSAPRSLTAAGLLIGFGGLVLLIGPANFIHPFSWSPGTMALVAAPITWALGSVYSKSAKLPDSPFMSTAIEMLAGGGLLLMMGLISGEHRSLSAASFTPASMWALAYLIVFGSMVGFTAYIWLLKNVSLPLASTYAYVNPVVAVVLGWMLGGEQITVMTGVAGGIILLSVAVITWSSKPASKHVGSVGVSTS